MTQDIVIGFLAGVGTVVLLQVALVLMLRTELRMLWRSINGQAVELARVATAAELLEGTATALARQQLDELDELQLAFDQAGVFTAGALAWPVDEVDELQTPPPDAQQHQHLTVGQFVGWLEQVKADLERGHAQHAE